MYRGAWKCMDSGFEELFDGDCYGFELTENKQTSPMGWDHMSAFA